MGKTLILIFVTAWLINACSTSTITDNSAMEASSGYIDLSTNLISTQQKGGKVEDILNELSSIPPEALNNQLFNDDRKKAFWINVYNGSVQHLLRNDPALYSDRNDFFSEVQVEIAGKKLSLDDIEHGILRHSAAKVFLGYIKDPFPGDFEKTFRVDKVDPRVHFAINCGAASCPPVTIYKPELINSQLDSVTSIYLEGNSEYLPNENLIRIPKLFSWFRGDFGGSDGTLVFLKKYGIIPPNAEPDIEYLDYDWTLEVGNYSETLPEE